MLTLGPRAIAELMTQSEVPPPPAQPVTSRLNEARRQMLTENVDASNAASRTGYESASQFSREYSREFGAPPRRDIDKLLRSKQSGVGVS